MKKLGATGFGAGGTVFQGQFRSQRGGTRTKSLLALIVLAALVFAAIKIVPTFVNNYELQDSMQQEARFNFNPNNGVPRTPDDMRADIEKKAKDLGLPIQLDNIQVSRDGNRVSISADYMVSFDLIVYQWQHHFHIQADNTSI